ncbi:MAG TPA: ComF family protein [Nitrospirae bacterium]|nr:DNA utilization protein GntX [bacterium BMS3Bbin09]HDO67476.1 ComF family protein [Nitrospirota bacterium]HEW81650.1 ComF family protein [Nitrospirota bacterium]
MILRSHIKNKVLNTLFPEKCPVCNENSSDHKTAPICTVCWNSIQPYEGPRCNRCGLPLNSDSSIICGECIKDEPAYRSVRTFGLYKGPLKKAINLLKYHNMKRLSKPLSEIILRMEIPQVDAVIPVPLYKDRLRQREFNQSALLAKFTARKSGASLIVDCLVKVKDTMPQVGLSSRDRRKNLRNAFGVENKELIEGKVILLLDDVITTGATVRECSRVLKKAGAGNIYVIGLAHGTRD